MSNSYFFVHSLHPSLYMPCFFIWPYLCWRICSGCYGKFSLSASCTAPSILLKKIYIGNLVSYSYLNSAFDWSLIGLVVLPNRTMRCSINPWPDTPSNPFFRLFFSSKNSGKTAAMIYLLIACWKFLQADKLNYSRSQVFLIVLCAACVAPIG